MDFYLLLPEEAAALLEVPVSDVLSLVESRKLGAFRTRGRWWIPLQCLAEMGSGFKLDVVRSLEALVRMHGDTLRQVALDPQASQRIESARHPAGSVGHCLQQALLMSRRFDELGDSVEA